MWLNDPWRKFKDNPVIRLTDPFSLATLSQTVSSGFGLDSCFIQRGGFKICGVPLTAQGKDIQVSPKVLLPFTHTLHHKFYKNPEQQQRKGWRKRKTTFNDKMNILPRMGLGEEAAFSFLIAQRYKRLI